MSSDELTRTQVKAIRDALFPGLNYLYRLKQRMVKAGFPEDDKLYKLVCEAYEASWALRLEVLSMPARHRPTAEAGMIGFFLAYAAIKVGSPEKKSRNLAGRCEFACTTNLRRVCSSRA